MGLQTVPAYIGETGYQHPVELDRNLLEGLFGRSGVLRYGDFFLAPTGVAQQFSITPGRAFLIGAESAQQGGYFAWSDASENQVLGAPSGSPRIDAVLLRAVDTQYGSDPGSPRAEWDIVPGTPASSPTAPADSLFNTGGGNYKPGAWWRVADIRVNPGDTIIPGPQITNYLRYVRNSEGRTLALSTDTLTDMVYSDVRFDLDTGISRRWNGTEWRMTEPYRRYVELASAAPNAVFSTIPRTLKRLRIHVMARADNTTPFYQNLLVRFGGDIGSNYAYSYGYSSNGTNPVPLSSSPATNISAGYVLSNAAGQTNKMASVVINVPGWNLPNSRASGLQCNFQGSAQAGTNYLDFQGGGEYFGTASLTSVTILPGSGNFMAGSQFLLEGWD